MDGAEILTRLVIAAALTGVIGLDRELRAKPAGLRTNIVVGTATAAFAYVGAEVIGGAGADPTRVASQVVSGIGFLGGGAIFAAGDKPSGLTTAAALWGSAAVGLAAGLGAFGLAALLVAVLVLVLWPLDWVAERPLRRWGRHDLHLQVVLREVRDIADVRQVLAGRNLRVVQLQLRELAGHPVADVQLTGRRQELGAAATAIDELAATVVVAHAGLEVDA
jgi:putative Mg2+ transporter-C (MgtC) family protein